MRVVGVTGDTSSSPDSWSFLGYAPLSTQPMFLFCSLIVLSIKGEKHSNIYIKMCVPVHHANAVLQTRSCASETIKNLNEHKT